MINVLENKFYNVIWAQGEGFKLHEQGKVLGSPAPGWLLLQVMWPLPEHLSFLRLAKIENMLDDWTFYDTAKAMLAHAAEKTGKRRISDIGLIYEQAMGRYGSAES